MINGKNSKKNNMTVIWLVLVSALLLLVIFSVCLGKYPVTAKESFSILLKAALMRQQTADAMTVNVVLNLRLPRILLSVLVGAALSVSGACYQAIFQNPLVSPDFLGVSSGACIGAAAAILLGLTSAYISAFAFFGGIAAVLITAAIPALVRNNSNIVLVLSGIITGSLMSSILGFIKYTADPGTQLASITYWTMGDFSYASSEDILPMLALLAPMAVLILISWWLDVLSLGPSEARALGADLKLLRTVAIVCSTLLTAGSICLAGNIGWVGLVVPHFSRMIGGASNRRVIPVSCVCGGLYMLAVDTVTRLIGAAEMPVSIMTGIIGAPFFFFLLLKRGNGIKA